MDVLEAIQARHSVRDFLSTPVPKHTVMGIMEAATRSPSGGNGQQASDQIRSVCWSVQEEGVISPVSDERVAILAPMRSEIIPVARALSSKRSGSEECSILWGRLGRTEIVATTTGIGTGAAAREAERVLDSGGISYLVVVGIAGSIGPSVDIGGLVVPEVAIDLSTDTQYRPSIPGGVEPRGKLATSDQLVSDPAEAARLERRGLIAVDMETAAIAAVCEHRRCPWPVFRAISDRADDGSTDSAISALVGPDGEPHLGAVVAAGAGIHRPDQHVICNK